ncbi:MULTISPECIES: peptidoglycan DD-metalloendopeptidase family protein [unclassified Moraxella]|uniref:peptidoglycan DD-metalloendopeptidase family protein n=1 Tax=unclassified Moraxella TaxID=2685852 RepID=UPI00359EBDCB
MAKFQEKRPATKRVNMLAVCGVAGAFVLAGCASKPTVQGSTNKQPIIKNSQSVITNSRGVPNRYMVKQGDTVSKIAERYGLDWRAIGRINNLDSSYTIYVGQWISLWQDGSNVKTSTTTIKKPTPKPAPNPVTTTIKPVAPVKQTVVVSPSPVPAHTPLPTTNNTPLSVGSVGVMQFRYPVSSSNPVARRFGTIDVGGQSVTSQGMWFSGRGGDAVLASRAGTVLHADGNIDGAMIAIAHTDGFVSSYFHIQDAQVKSGQTVQAGQRIASMRHQSNGSGLLEFRISRNSNYIDPLSVLK